MTVRRQQDKEALNLNLKMKYLNEIRVATTIQEWINKEFNSSVCAICFMYLRHLQPFETKRIWRFIIDLGREKKDCKGEVYIAERPFDFKHYFQLDDYGKKKTILDLIHTTMLALSEAKGFDQAKLTAAYNHCLAHNLENRWTTRYKRSPNHQHYGAITYLWEVDFCEATAILANKQKQEIVRKKLFKHLSGWLTYSHRKYGWESKSCFFLESVGYFTG